MKISVCIITKNERIALEKCLKCLKKLDVEIVVTDTGSTDGTKEMAAQYTDQIYDFIWCNDFAKAKNFSVSKAHYDHVMVIDSDEYVTVCDLDRLEKLVQQNPYKVGRIERLNETEQNGNPMVAKERVNRVYDRREFHYEGSIHEQLVRKDGAKYETYLVPVSALHDGYLLDPKQREAKAMRNIQLLKEELKRGADPYILYQLGKGNYLKNDYKMAADYLGQTLEYDLEPNLEYVIDAVETYGYALINSGQYEEALAYENIEDTFGKSSDFEFLMGFIYMNNQLFDRAQASFMKAVELKNGKTEGVDSYLAYYNAGVIKECLGYVDKAMEFYLKCGQYPPAVRQIGKYLEEKNLTQAYLFYRQKKWEAKNTIYQEQVNQIWNEFGKKNNIVVPRTAIILLSYNGLDDTKACIESIRKNCAKEEYELIVVDNASTDGSAEWLKQQTDLKLQCNQENVGFPAGCNQGIHLADINSNIWLLNNDTLVPEGGLFWLNMGLYENEKVAAAGSMSNYSPNYQNIAEMDVTDQNYEQYNSTIKRHLDNPYERKMWLVGFSILLRRDALEQVGYLDEQFTPGNYEDTDLGYRLAQAGYQQLLCKNSFIFHYGSHSFGKKKPRFYGLLEQNEKKFWEKWNIHPEEKSEIEKECITFLKDRERKEQFSILQLSCGMGATLARLQYLYPNAQITGTESDQRRSALTRQVAQIKTGDLEEYLKGLPEGARKKYDYVIAAGMWEETVNPSEELMRIQEVLAPEGFLITKIINRDGYGLKRKEKAHYFTAEEWVDLLLGYGYEIEDLFYHNAEEKMTQQQREECRALGQAGAQEYLFKAKRIDKEH